MVRITDELMEHLQELARMELSQDQKESLKKDMQEILDYMELLNELDVSNVEPMYTPIEGSSPLRKDVPKPFENVEGIKENFPKEKEGHIEVPGIHR